LSAPVDWWKDFFGGLTVDFWRAVIPEEATREEAEFLWKHLQLRPGAHVLDVPCGAGRLSLALSERGAALTGVDISQEFLDAGEHDASERGLSIAFRRAEMRDLPGRGDFDAAFCFGNSFGFLDDAGNEKFLEAVGGTLKPGGRFAIDYGQTAEGIFPGLEPHLEAEMSGFRFVEETRYDPLCSRVENVFTISRGGRAETKLASHRVYMAGDVARMLERAGFEVLDLFGSTKEEPFGLKAQRLLIVARTRRSRA
jgi:SAM-dependent methyltransferase